MRKVAVPPGGIILLPDVTMEASAAVTGPESDATTSLTYSAVVEPRFARITCDPEPNYRKASDNSRAPNSRDSGGRIRVDRVMGVNGTPPFSVYTLANLQYGSALEGIWSDNRSYEWHANGTSWTSDWLHLYESIGTDYLPDCHSGSMFDAWYANQVKGELGFYDDVLLTVTDNLQAASASNGLDLYLHWPVENLHRENDGYKSDEWRCCSPITYNPLDQPLTTQFQSSQTFTFQTSVEGSVGVSVEVLQLSLGCDITNSATHVIGQTWTLTIAPHFSMAKVAMPFHREFDAVFDAFGSDGYLGRKRNRVKTFYSATKAEAEANDHYLSFKTWWGTGLPDSWMPDPEV